MAWSSARAPLQGSGVMISGLGICDVQFPPDDTTCAIVGLAIDHLQDVSCSPCVTVQERWDNIKASCLNAAKYILGEKERTTKSQNKEIVRLSENQRN